MREVDSGSVTMVAEEEGVEEATGEDEEGVEEGMTGEDGETGANMEDVEMGEWKKEEDGETEGVAEEVTMEQGDGGGIERKREEIAIGEEEKGEEE